MSTPPRVQRGHQGFNDPYNPVEPNKKRSKTRRGMTAPSDPRFIGVNEFGLQVASSNPQNYEPPLNANVMLFDPTTGYNIYTKARMNRNVAMNKYKRNRATAKAMKAQRGAGFFDWIGSFAGKKPEGEEVTEEEEMIAVAAPAPVQAQPMNMKPTMGGKRKRKTRRRHAKRKATHLRRKATHLRRKATHRRR